MLPSIRDQHVFVSCCVLLVACATPSAAPRAPAPEPPEPVALHEAPVPAPPAASSRQVGPSAPECLQLPSELGRVQTPELDEISGIVESARARSVFFVHNDSGDSPRIFAIDTHGRLLATVTLPGVPLVFDAEAIARGPGPSSGSFIYLADVGNNLARSGRGLPRGDAVLYRFPEPQVAPDMQDAELTASEVHAITVVFPDRPHDVEAVLVDPLSGDALLITKEDTGPSLVLRAPAAALDSGRVLLEPVAKLQFGAAPLSGSRHVTAADISRDGTRILLRTYSSVFMFERRAGETVAAALERAPRQLPAPNERQGEALAFFGDSAFVTISEGSMAPVLCTKISE